MTPSGATRCMRWACRSGIVAERGARALGINRFPYPDLTVEIVNFIDGSRTLSDIRDAMSAELGSVPLAAVTESLDLRARIGAITFR